MSARGWFLFALMSVIWGIPYLMIKVAVDGGGGDAGGGVSVPMVVFARTALGAALLLPLALRAGRFGQLRGHAVPILGFAAFEIIGPWALLSDAERHLDSSTTGLLIAAVPILAVVLARLTGGDERLGVRRWAGLAVGLGGVALLAAPQLSGGSAWSLTEVLLTAVGYAAAPLIAARRLREVPTLPLTATCLTLAAVVYAPPAVATWPDTRPSAEVLASLAGLGVICTALGFVIFFELIREVGASRAMVFTYVSPAVAVVAGVALLDEPLTATVLGSFGLILTGCLLATARDRAGATEPAAPEAGPVGPVSPDRPVAGSAAERSRRRGGRRPRNGPDGGSPNGTRWRSPSRRP
ncbi:DMT family transporter [Streptomyces sp. B6B3]|uniref:DMT family transporter n=1 Tax=Streptomyces sp. B6B3 TaxID=3153570 RepID=UPI00325F4DE4